METTGGGVTDKQLRTACPVCGLRSTHIKLKACKCGYQYSGRKMTAHKATHLLEGAAQKLADSDIEYVTLAIAPDARKKDRAFTVVHNMASARLQPLVTTLVDAATKRMVELPPPSVQTVSRADYDALMARLLWTQKELMDVQKEAVQLRAKLASRPVPLARAPDAEDDAWC